MAAPATGRSPGWAKPFLDTDNPPRPAARAIRSLKAEEAFGDSVRRPYLHLVDGGVSDNLGMRGVLDALEVFEALHEAGMPTPLDNASRIIVFVVNSLSSPPTNWDESPTPPGTVNILLKSSGTPIDAFSFEAVELLRDTAASWADHAPDPGLGGLGRQQGSRRWPRRCACRTRRSMPSTCRSRR